MSKLLADADAKLLAQCERTLRGDLQEKPAFLYGFGSLLITLNNVYIGIALSEELGFSFKLEAVNGKILDSFLICAKATGPVVQQDAYLVVLRRIPISYGKCYIMVISGNEIH